MKNLKLKKEDKYSVLNNNYPTIGLLTEGLTGPYQIGVWPGIVDTAREKRLNLVCFTGGALSISPTEPWEYQRNILYDIAEKNMELSGLIIAGSLGGFVADEKIKEFLNRYSHLPIVTLAPTSESIPAVFVNNRKGMQDLITHLVEYHKYKKFAFIRGPEGNVEAEERLKIYRDVLESNNIPIDPYSLIPGDFTRECGLEAVNVLYSLNEKYDAIVAAVAETALGALEGLLNKGIKVPDDVALVGFDDIVESRYVTPPLTTVRQPLYELGKTAVEMLWRLLKGEEIPKNTILDARLIIRESCGCSGNKIDSRKLRKTLSKSSQLKNFVSEKDIMKTIAPLMEHTYAEYTREIISCFCNDINKKKSITFLPKLLNIGRVLVAKGKNLTAWNKIFFELWYYFLSHLDKETFAFADDILLHARSVLGELGQREQGYLRSKMIRENAFLREIGESFANTLDIGHLMDMISARLPQIGIYSYYIFLYKSNKMPSKKSRLILCCIKGEKQDIGENGITFDTNNLLPKNIIPNNNKAHVIVTEPLFFQREQFGVALFEAEMHEGEIFEVLSEYIRGAIHSALLVKKIQNQTEVLSKANLELERLREKEHAYLQAIKGELELGRKIQMGFLPQKIPQPKGWEVAVSFMPAREVSGDFYDTFMLGNDLLALIIADVSGKDVSAALFMSLIRTLLRVFSERAYTDDDDPLDAVGVVNDYIIQHHRQGDGRCMFATMVFGLLNPKTGEFTYINAGHNPPFVIQSNEKYKKLSPTGPAVGLAANMVFKRQKTSISSGEMLFTYTDGVTEAQSPEGKFFTTEKLIELLLQVSPSASEHLDKITSALKTHSGKAAPFDDITMLAAKRD